jgi:hypothetical protein
LAKLNNDMLRVGKKIELVLIADDPNRGRACARCAKMRIADLSLENVESR